MQVRSLHHVQLAMPAGREEEARAFYHGLLGIPETAKPSNLAARGGCWFESGALRVHLGVETAFAPARKAHPAFLVTGLRALGSRLREAGCRVSEDVALAELDRLFVDDPSGNRIELLEEKPS